RVRNVEDIASTIVKFQGGAPVTIGQVADVVLGPALQRGTAADSGQPAVVLSIQKAPGTNTLALTEQVDALLDQVAASLPEGVVLNRQVFRQADFILRSVRNVTHVL